MAGSEFVVGRVAHRNSTSDYLIDGRKQPAKVVIERLKQEGIDLNHNRFLILQVEIHGYVVYQADVPSCAQELTATCMLSVPPCYVCPTFQLAC